MPSRASYQNDTTWGSNQEERGKIMAKFNIKELLEKHTSDGEVDYTKVNEELETQNRNIVVKESSKEIDKIKEETLDKYD